MAARRHGAASSTSRPASIVTLVLWLAGGILFGRYLAEFATNYVTMYAGLASAMIALVFLYWIATIFVYGGELNAEILERARAPDAPRKRPRATPPPPNRPRSRSSRCSRR